MRSEKLGSNTGLLANALYRLSRGELGAISLEDYEAIRSAVEEISPLLRSEGSDRVVIWAVTGFSPKKNAVFATLGKALEIRGLEVAIVLCGEVLDACDKLRHAGMKRLDRTQWKAVCSKCYVPGLNYYEAWGLPCLTLGQLVSSERIEELKTIAESLPESELSEYAHRGVRLARHVRGI